MNYFPENTQDVERFVAELETIPWFTNDGKPTPRDLDVRRIYSWDEWPGAESSEVDTLGIWLSQLRDSLLRESGWDPQTEPPCWERIRTTVIRVAAPNVPYDPERAAWHAPNAAVWQAAWTAGLVDLCLKFRRPVPPELQEQWEWFGQGHWPIGFYEYDEHGPLLVY